MPKRTAASTNPASNAATANGSRLRRVRWLADRIIAATPTGPAEHELSRGSRVLAVASMADGRRAEVRVRGPEAYVFTARAAVACIEAVGRGHGGAGFKVPSQVLGLDGLALVEGVETTP